MIFEGDYHGLLENIFLKLNSELKEDKIKVAVASHTPLHRSLEGLNLRLEKLK